ncbi:MAG: class I SAM-dependent methyltransferase [Candidatus Moraniibacteriota bacterium]
MNYPYRNLFELHPEAKTFLDLGCGRGFVSLYAAARGLTVDAVDIEKEIPVSLEGIPSVTYKVADLKDWRPTKRYDIIVIHHSLQFLPKAYVLQEFLPTICQALNPGGVLEVFTFTPEETLPVPTTYTLDEIVSAVKELNIIEQKTYSYDGTHRKLGPHTFHELHIIAKKKI